MSFVEAIRSVFTQFSNFSGRARRSEFWWYYLFECAVCFGLSIIGNVTGIDVFTKGIFVFQVIMLVPGLAVCFRRMHDTGKSAWWLLPALIPVAGQIYMMLWFLKDSEPGENKYGPNPKGQ